MTEGPLPPELNVIDPLESGIEFFEEQRRFNFLFNYQCNKVFLNHVDSFNGRHILRYIGCREYSKPVVYEEIPGEASSVSIQEPVVSSQISLKSSAIESEGMPPPGDSSEEDSKPVISKTQPQEKTGEGDELPILPGEEVSDSLISVLGGLLTQEQVAVLKSLPNRLLRAEYLKNILNQIEPKLELLHEEHPAQIMGYDICGTLKYCDECMTEIQFFLKERVTDLKAYLPTLLSCSTVIFDISRDPSQIEEARWALRAILCSLQYLEKKSMSCFKQIKDVRKFILISSAMTWENTDRMKIRKKPVTEENLPNRKPHPLFREHKHLEQEVIRAGLKYPDIFKTCVLASGIPYGYEEDRLNYLFDLGWKNEEELPILGNGHNSLPVIHVEDLAMLVFHCMVRVYITPAYFFAVEKQPPTLLQVTEGISKGLTTGKTTVYPVDQPLPLNISIHEDTYAMLTSELLLEPTIYKLDLPWKYHMNMVHNMATIVDEYIEYRNLSPVKIIVGGVPAGGKTKISQRIAQIYDLKYISAKETIKKYIEKLEAEALDEPMKSDGEEGEDEEQKAEESARDEDNFEPLFRNELEEIKHNMAINNGRLDDNITIRIMKKRLEEKDALNRGYLLDGWPETANQSHGLFGRGDVDDLSTPEVSEGEQENDQSDEEEYYGEDDQMVEIKTRNINIHPTFLIQLDGDCDDVLFRVLAAKEDLVRSHPSSVNLAQRMDQYRDLEKTCCRAFDYFDSNQLEMKILRYKVDADPCPFLGKTLKHILDSIGPPTNKGFLRRYLEEYGIIKKHEVDQLEKKRKERADGVERMDVEYFRAASEFMDKWVNFKDNVIKEKEECGGLNDQLLPQNVLETAVKALIDFKNTSPDDHHEFLAEYFLREYEKEKGNVKLSQPKAEHGVTFRRCVVSVLEHCDPSCLPLLPQAVDVILKFKRLAEIKGEVFPPVSCKDDIDDDWNKRNEYNIDPENIEAKFMERSSNASHIDYKEYEESSLSVKSIALISLDKLVELLVQTDPIWKEKLAEDRAGKKKVSDNSLKILLEQLKQLSCEIRYRLKKRGITAFDLDSTTGSCGVWPYDGPDQECSGEIRTQNLSEPSFDTRKNIEQLKKNDAESSRNAKTEGHVDSSNRSSTTSNRKTSSLKTESTRSSKHDSDLIDKKPSMELSIEQSQE